MKFITVRKVIAACMSVVIISSLVLCNISVASAATSAELQSQYNKLEQQQKELKAKMNKTQKDISQQQTYQKQLTQQMNVTKEQVAVLKQQIASLEGEIEQKNSEIAQKESDIAVKYDLFKKRLRAMYKSNQKSKLSMILSAESFGDMLSRIKISQTVSQYDSDLVKELNVQLEGIKFAKQELDAKKQQVEQSKAKMEQKNNELAASYAKSEEAESQLAKLKAMYTSDSAKIQNEMEILERELSKIYAGASNSSSSSYGGGQMLWPVPGYKYISSPYGARWGTTHKGMDIAGGGIHGANIVAASSGKVISVINSNSYGKYLVIDHGGGISTLYAHCSAIVVSAGQQVERGQVIAKVGSTGWSTGPHLHFEVRINGQHTNPQKYL